MTIILKSIIKRTYLFKFMLEIHDVRCLFKRCLTSSICFFGHANFLCNFLMHLVKIFSLFLLVKSSRYEVQKLLKNGLSYFVAL